MGLRCRRVVGNGPRCGLNSARHCGGGAITKAEAMARGGGICGGEEGKVVKELRYLRKG